MDVASLYNMFAGVSTKTRWWLASHTMFPQQYVLVAGLFLNTPKLRASIYVQFHIPIYCLNLQDLTPHHSVHIIPLHRA